MTHKDDWLRVDGTEVHLTEDAPQHIKDEFDENPERFQIVVEYALTQSAAGYADGDSTEYDLLDAKYLAEKERQEVDAAVERGDIDAAQEHKHYADTFEDLYRRYSNTLMGENDG